MKHSTTLVALVLAVAIVAVISLISFEQDESGNRAGMASRYLGPPQTEDSPTQYVGPPVPGPDTQDTSVAQAKDRPDARFDVVIAGAGSGGIAAAIQAARLGASVLVIEETDAVGGQILPVGNMDGGYNLPAGTGIYEEFESRMRAYYADPARFPPYGKGIGTCYWSAGTSCFEPRASQEILRQMLTEEGVTLWTQTRITSAIKSGNTVTGVITTRGTVRSEVLIDATEHGDIIPLTGARYRVGNSLSPNIDPNSCIDDITYTVMLKRYDTIPAQLRMTTPPPGYAQDKEEFKRTVTANGAAKWAGVYPVNWPVHNQYRGVPDSTSPGNYTGAQGPLITKSYANWANDYPAYATYNPLPQGKLYNLSVSYIENPADRKRMDCEAKLKTLNFIYYVQHELGQNWSVADEGFDTTYNRANLCANIPAEFKALERHFPPFPYVRESRRIVPIDAYTAKEMKASRQGAAIPTSIAVGEYGVDKHNCRDNATLDLGDTTNEMRQGGYFQVPMETLIPEQVDGFLAAEKNIGASRLAEGALRLQPITMATGQAAGALAAIAAQENKRPRDIKPEKVQRVLVQAGSAISNLHFTDVPFTHERWADVQLTTVDRTFVGYGKSRFGPQDPLLRGQAAVGVVGVFDIAPATPAQASFTDVPKAHMFYKQVEALKRDRITAGCSVNPARFCVNDRITRLQLSIFLTSAGGFTAPGERTFEDVAPAQQRFAQVAVSRGWFDECDTGFCPNQQVTRGEMARIIGLER